LRSLLKEAGFRNPRVADQPLPTRFVMLAEAQSTSMQPVPRTGCKTPSGSCEGRNTV
jgi:hypothetical protein